MSIKPIHASVRMASGLARWYQDQLRRDNEVALGQRFAALDLGLARSTSSAFGGGAPITLVADRDDPLEQVWRLRSRRGAAGRPRATSPRAHRRRVSSSR
jgi:hypothetical protein